MFGFRALGRTRVCHRKNTAKMTGVRMPIPAEVLLPTAQHIGAPAAAAVKKGDTVKAGDVIGKLSSIPCEEADGAHLHLELSVSGEGMDPQNVISQELTKQADATKNTTTTTQSSH